MILCYDTLRDVPLFHVTAVCHIFRFCYVTIHVWLYFLSQVRISEQERIIGELGRGLQQAEMKGDRRLVEYQKKYEQRIQFLMNKLRDAESNETPDDRITYAHQFATIGNSRLKMSPFVWNREEKPFKCHKMWKRLPFLNFPRGAIWILWHVMAASC